MKNLNLPVLALLVGFVAVLGTGCTVTLRHDNLNNNGPVSRGTLAINETADKSNDTIGWGTLTLLSIPVAPVTVDGGARKVIMSEICDLAEHDGYQAKIVNDQAAASDLPFLSCHVRTFSFHNFTYFFPLVVNSGVIQLDIKINAPDGRFLWNKTYTGEGSGFYSFDSTVNQAWSTVFKDLSDDLARIKLDMPTPNAPKTTEPSPDFQLISPLCSKLDSSNPGEVINALKRFRQMNASVAALAVPRILICLGNNNPNVVREACRTLGLVGSSETTTHIQPLLSNSRSDIWKDAQVAINKLSVVNAGEWTGKLDDSNTGQVINALKRIREMNAVAASTAIPQILHCLDNNNPGIVREACRTLGIIGNRGTIAHIQPLLSNSRNDIRKDAQQAIDKINGWQLF